MARPPLRLSDLGERTWVHHRCVDDIDLGNRREQFERFRDAHLKHVGSERTVVAFLITPAATTNVNVEVLNRVNDEGALARARLSVAPTQPDDVALSDLLVAGSAQPVESPMQRAFQFEGTQFVPAINGRVNTSGGTGNISLTATDTVHVHELILAGGAEGPAAVAGNSSKSRVGRMESSPR